MLAATLDSPRVLTPKEHAGRILSIALHPFVLLPVSIVWASSEMPARSRAAVLAAFVGVALAISIFVAREMKRGAVTDVDVSVARDRPRMYAVSIVSLLASGAVLALTGGPPAAVRCTLVAGVMLLVASIANTKIKVSLHAAFAVFAAAVVVHAGPVAWITMGAAALLVGWARVAYGRHNRAEVACGYVLGGLGGLAIQLAVR